MRISIREKERQGSKDELEADGVQQDESEDCDHKNSLQTMRHARALTLLATQSHERRTSGRKRTRQAKDTLDRRNEVGQMPARTRQGHEEAALIL